MSGSPLAFWARYTSVYMYHSLEEYTQMVASKAGCVQRDSERMIECLRGVNSTVFMDIHWQVCISIVMDIHWQVCTCISIVMDIYWQVCISIIMDMHWQVCISIVMDIHWQVCISIVMDIHWQTYVSHSWIYTGR